MSVFVILKLIGSLALFDVWYEDHERSLAKTDGWAFASCAGCHDNKPLHRTTDWYVCDSFRTVFYCDDGDDR